jgi:hypothetical protein
MKGRFYFLLLAIPSFLFVLLFFVLSYYDRLAADDFYYLGGYSERGVWGCMRDLYIGYSARWTAYLLTGWIISLNSFKQYHFIFNCVTYFTLVVSLCFLIKNTLLKLLNIKLSKKVNLLYALILSCSFFFSSYSPGETWFWLVQVCTYLWSIIMSLTLINILLDEKLKAIHILLIIISSVFIGGASESFALINIFLLSSCLILSNSGIRKALPVSFSSNRTVNKKIILALLFLLISFGITMIGPGNEVRYNALPKVNFIQTVWIQIKSFIKIIFIRTPSNMHYLFLFSLPWLILGKYLSPSIQKMNLLPVLFSLKKYFFIVLILIFIFLVPTSFIMSELGPDRALSQISFLISFCFAVLFFIIGFRVQIRERTFQILKIITVISSLAVLTITFQKQFSISKRYAAAYDQRMHFLTDLNKSGQKNVIELNALPSSGMIYSAEISTDTSYFTNNFLEYALHLQFDVKRKQSTY